jgi:hypothetical protein
MGDKLRALVGRTGLPTARSSQVTHGRGLKVPVSQCLGDLDTGYLGSCDGDGDVGTPSMRTSRHVFLS